MPSNLVVDHKAFITPSITIASGLNPFWSSSWPKVFLVSEFATYTSCSVLVSAVVSHCAVSVN